MQKLQTSKEWLDDLYPDNDLVVYDPDGWDRSNFQYSYHEEKITEKEFRKRLLASTCFFTNR